MEDLEIKKIFFGKKVLITGHTGFKGAWLAMMLKELGAQVYGFSIGIEERSLYQLLNLSSIFHQEYFGSIQNTKDFTPFCNEIEPDFIFHLAAQSLVYDSYTRTFETFESNVMGTLVVMEYHRQAKKSPVSILVTTDKVYQNPENGSYFKETDPLGANDPYSTSKACAELLIQSYFQTLLSHDQRKIGVVRSGNVIGGGDWADNRLIPDFFNAKINKQKLTIRHPYSLRPWMHVFDTLLGYLKAALYIQKSDVDTLNCWNFAPEIGRYMTVIDVCNHLSKKVDFNDIVIEKSTFKEAKILKLDATKATRELSWKCHYSIEQAIEHTADWYQVYLSQNKEIIPYSWNEVRTFLATQ